MEEWQRENQVVWDAAPKLVKGTEGNVSDALLELELFDREADEDEWSEATLAKVAEKMQLWVVWNEDSERKKELRDGREDEERSVHREEAMNALLWRR